MNRLYPDHPAGAQTARENVVEGMESWRAVSRWAIVSTHPENLSGLYEYLMARKPSGLNLIGGVSTYSLPGCTDRSKTKPYDYADVEEWRRITERCQHIANVTACNTVLLENETALRRFYGGEPVDLARLRRALAPLRETGLWLLWYLPTIAEPTKTDPNRTERTAALVQTIHESLPKCRFICGHIGYPDWSRDTTMQWRRQVMFGAFDCVNYLFASRDGVYTAARKPVWTPHGAMAEANRLNLNVLIVYPGLSAWADTAKAFATLGGSGRARGQP